MVEKKKLSVSVEVQDDGCFKIELSSGFLSKKHMVAESVDSLIQKVTIFLKTELSRVQK
jgi:uncharacterized protein YlzI (FlbEa/FlbD family)